MRIPKTPIKRKWSVMLGLMLLILILSPFLYNFYLTITSDVENLIVSNVTDSSASILWTTSKPTPGKVTIETSDGKRTFYDDSQTNFKRDLSFKEKVLNSITPLRIHHVTMYDLPPETEIKYEIVSGIFSRDIPINQLKTKRVSDNLKTPEPVYGRVNLAGGATPSEGVVTLRLYREEGKFSEYISSIIYQGTYTMDASTFYDEETGLRVFSDETDLEEITTTVVGLEGEIQSKLVQISVLDDQPVGDINFPLLEKNPSSDGGSALVLGVSRISDSLMARPIEDDDNPYECTPGASEDREISGRDCTRSCPDGRWGGWKCEDPPQQSVCSNGDSDTTRLSGKKCIRYCENGKWGGWDCIADDPTDNPGSECEPGKEEKKVQGIEECKRRCDNGNWTSWDCKKIDFKDPKDEYKKECDIGDTQQREDGYRECFRGCKYSGRDRIWGDWVCDDDEGANPKKECEMGESERKKAADEERGTYMQRDCKRVGNDQIWGNWYTAGAPKKECNYPGETEEQDEGWRYCKRECKEVDFDLIWGNWTCDRGGTDECQEGETDEKNVQGVKCKRECVRNGYDEIWTKWVCEDEYTVACAKYTTPAICKSIGCGWNGDDNKCVPESELPQSTEPQDLNPPVTTMCEGQGNGYYCSGGNLYACTGEAGARKAIRVKGCSQGCSYDRNGKAGCNEELVENGSADEEAYEQIYDIKNIYPVEVDAENFTQGGYCVYVNGKKRYVTQGTGKGPDFDENQYSHLGFYNGVDVACSSREDLGGIRPETFENCKATCDDIMGCNAVYSGGGKEDMRLGHLYAGRNDQCDPIVCQQNCQIPRCGNTGYSTGYHTDVAVRTGKAHPCDYIPSKCIDCAYQIVEVGVGERSSFLQRFDDQINAFIYNLKESFSINSALAQENQTLLDQKVSENDPLQPGTYLIRNAGLTTRELIAFRESAVMFFDDKNGNGLKDPDEEYLDPSDTEDIILETEKVAEIVEYELEEGLNLISFPMIMIGEETSQVSTASELVEELNGQGAQISQVAIYRGKFIVYKEMIDENGQRVTFGDDFQVVPGDGVFVYSNNERRVFLAGNKILDSLEIFLSGGWNLVGIYNQSLEVHKSEDILKLIEQTTDIEADAMTEWKNGRYNNLVYTDGTVFGIPFDVERTKGYWIRVSDGEGKFSP